MQKQGAEGGMGREVGSGGVGFAVPVNRTMSWSIRAVGDPPL